LKVKNAFSLFEILLVLGLILLIVTITVPVGGFLSDFFITNEIERLEVFYQYLRQRSIASGKTHVLVFDLKLMALAFNFRFCINFI
jgi:type II secretory pathway pseudopilin PulG